MHFFCWICAQTSDCSPTVSNCSFQNWCSSKHGVVGWQIAIPLNTFTCMTLLACRNSIMLRCAWCHCWNCESCLPACWTVSTSPSQNLLFVSISRWVHPRYTWSVISWFFKIDFVHQLYQMGFKLASLPAIFSLPRTLKDIRHFPMHISAFPSYYSFPSFLSQNFCEFFIPTMTLVMDVRTSFFPMLPQELSYCSMILGFEIVVGVPKLLGTLFPVILTLLKHLQFLKQHCWLRLRNLAVSKLHLTVFGSSHMRCRRTFFSEYCIGSWIILHCVTCNATRTLCLCNLGS